MVVGAEREICERFGAMGGVFDDGEDRREGAERGMYR